MTRFLGIFAILLSFVLGACTSARGVPVLLYHRISSEPGDVERVSLDQFNAQMDLLAERHFTPMSTEDLRQYLEGKTTLPEHPVLITFDDGWRSQLLALPALKKHQFKATFFVFPEKGIEDPYGDYLRWEDVVALTGEPGFEVGSHSMTHPWDRERNLVAWSEGRASEDPKGAIRHELYDSKSVLESKLGIPVTSFAWPMGWYDEQLTMASEAAGYKTAFTTDPGLNRSGDDPHRVKRLFVDGSCSMEQFAQLVQSGSYPLCPSGFRPNLKHRPW